MNKENFQTDIARLTNTADYADFYNDKRKLNEQLWQAAETNNFDLVVKLL
jgi:hypothetical protein